MSYRRNDVETFPGGGYYMPSVSGSASITVLTMTDKEQQAVKERKRRPFGFARVLEEENDAET